MKAIIRIPTEQYAYIEVEFEGTEEEIINKSREITEMYKNNSVGLSSKEFNVALDRYLSVSTISEDVYHKMSLSQQAIIQEIKKAFKRMEAKESKGAMDALMDNSDIALEHQFHTEYYSNCSECYKQNPENKGRILQANKK